MNPPSERSARIDAAAPRPQAMERAFSLVREELGIRVDFPDDVVAETARVIADRIPLQADGRTDATAIPFVTIDPPGSRDLDQAVHAERAGTGYRVRYAIADVGYWVDRGSAIEAEAWRRGVTYYAPDERAPLYPAALSQGAASLLPGEARPAVLFDFTLDDEAGLCDWTLQPALVRSRAQLTYTELLEHARGGSTTTRPRPSPEWADTLTLLGEVGPKRLALEAQRGGVSLPVRDQHVQRQAATALGYSLAYEEPNDAERWNAEISLLTGHVAALRMLDAGVGLLRTMPPFAEREVTKFQRIARALGFRWPQGETYGAFIHDVDPRQPRVDVLVRQARRVMHGADYTAFDGAPPDAPQHGALAFAYAHATAPLRRLADRYVLDLLVTLAAGRAPSAHEVHTLRALPPVMSAAGRRANVLERRVVDIAEAWALRDAVGSTIRAVVVDLQGATAEVQVEEPPVRATLTIDPAQPPTLGAAIRARVASVDLTAGAVTLTLDR